MREIQGDLFNAENLSGEQRIVIPHVCNDKGKWGAGFVIPLGRAFPASKEMFNARFADGSGVQGTTQFSLCGYRPHVVVANMVAQTLFTREQKIVRQDRPLSYRSLAACMNSVGDYAVAYESRIVCPRFGSALAGGNWEFIKELIKDFWVDRGVDVTVFYL
jgi:hypothetical protein